jgi:hypothetical protein
MDHALFDIFRAQAHAKLGKQAPPLDEFALPVKTNKQTKANTHRRVRAVPSHLPLICPSNPHACPCDVKE